MHCPSWACWLGSHVAHSAGYRWWVFRVLPSGMRAVGSALGHQASPLRLLLLLSIIAPTRLEGGALARIQRTLRGGSDDDDGGSDGRVLRIEPASRVSVDESRGLGRLANGYVEVVVDLRRPALRELRSDPSGQGRYGHSLLAGRCGFALESERRHDDRGGGGVRSSCQSGGRAHRYAQSTTAEVATLALFDVLDDERSPMAREQWEIALRRGDRSFTLRTNGTVVRAAEVTALRHHFALVAPSVYGLYDRGVVQMMKAGSQRGFYASRVPLRRAYVLGGDGAHAGSLDFSAADGIAARLGGGGLGQTVLLSDRRGMFTSTLHSGEHLVVGGPFLVSPNQQFHGRVESGAMVVYRHVAGSGDEIVWQSGPVWPSQGDACTLVLQEDSNLVLYAGPPNELGKVLWSSHTWQPPEDGNSILHLNNHGELLLYPSDNIEAAQGTKAPWSSGLAGGWRHADAGSGRSDCLRHGEMLQEGGAALVSSNGLFSASLRHVDNQLKLVVAVQDHRDRGAVVWLSESWSQQGSADSGVGTLILQDDGNLVIYWQPASLMSQLSSGLGRPVWDSRSHGETREDYILRLQDDGVLVLGTSSETVWTSTSRSSSFLPAGKSMDASVMLLSDDLRFIATLADDQISRAGLAVLFYDGTEYLTVSAHGASSSEKPCEPGLPVTLTMQEDGNLVLHRVEPVLVQRGNGDPVSDSESVFVWATDTHGTKHIDLSLVLRDDGSLAIAQFKERGNVGAGIGQPAWTSAAISSRMGVGDTLGEGYFLLSDSGEFSAVMEAGGRLIVYRYGDGHQHRLGSRLPRFVHWCATPDEDTTVQSERGSDESDSATSFHSLALQTDGDLVIIRHWLTAEGDMQSETVYNSGTAHGGKVQRELVLTDLGALQLIDVSPGGKPAAAVVWTSSHESQLCRDHHDTAAGHREELVGDAASPGENSTAGPAATGLQRVILGAVPTELEDRWSDGWAQAPATRIVEGQTWSTELRITPNSKNFPAGGGDTPHRDGGGDGDGSFHLDANDYEALMVGIWATAVGCLTTTKNAVVDGQRFAMTSPTLAAPVRGYSGFGSFFDPDSFFALSALLISGDLYLVDQVREVLQFSASHQGSRGQLPHHFEKGEPRFEALSGAVQTGPSIFWALSCLEYVKYSGDHAWLRQMIPRLRRATAFCMGTQQHTPGARGLGLVRSKGSLLIDTFVRANYSTDTNAMLAGFLLPEMADAEESLGNSTGAEQLRSSATKLSTAINEQLWLSDHFATQLNPDGGFVDMVDYDANLIAVAGGVATGVPGRASKIMRRIDNGGNKCAAWGSWKGGPQWVSERYYGPEQTYLRNTGDSWCGMARIAYFDALSRIATGRSDLFDGMLDHLSKDVIANTWLPERYGCSGDPQRNRTAFFFEYPSVVTLMIAQLRYGIKLGLRSVSIAPSSQAPASFSWHVGAGTGHELWVRYSKALVRAIVPGASQDDGKQPAELLLKNWTVRGMSAKGLYTVDVAAAEGGGARAKSCDAAKAAARWKRKKVLASSEGLLRFAALAVPGCEVRVERRRRGLHVEEV
jgi:hypothetical protein